MPAKVSNFKQQPKQPAAPVAVDADCRAIAEAQVYKKHLVGLVNALSEFFPEIDSVLRQEPSPERGMKLARLLSALVIAKETAMQFGLGYSHEEIKDRRIKR